MRHVQFALPWAFALAFLCAPLVASASGSARSSGLPDADVTIGEVIRDIEQHRTEDALKRIDALLLRHPNFRLAHLIRGDLLLARARPLSAFGASPDAPAEKLSDLREEAIARLKAYRNKPPSNYVPRYLLQMEPDQKFAVVVDTQRSRLYIYQNDNGRPRFVADYYIAHGKLGAEKTREGDKRTPVGVYHVTANLPRQKLSDFYGSGAFPINYPNEWDRQQGRNGHGIWLHGTPSDTYSRPPRASDGCVVLTNQDLDALSGYLQIGLTPVIISNTIEWLSLDDWASERAALNREIETWRRDWESRDVDRYLAHYSRAFRNNEGDYAQWAQQKRLVAAGKSWIKVDLSKLSVFRNPGKEDMIVVTFEQDYRSNNLSNTLKKRQYWVKEGGRWKIIYEGFA